MGFRSRLILGLLIVCGLFSCHKGFLDAKPDSTILEPTTFSDFQALLDNTLVIGFVPTLGEASADDYYFPGSYWNLLDKREYNAYIWAYDIFDGQGEQQDWNLPYAQAYYANVVLDGLAKIAVTADNAAQWNAMNGAALFTRAFAFYNLAQIFAPIYDSGTAAADMGIPIRLHSDISTPTVRASVQTSYDQIFSDLKTAAASLSNIIPTANLNRPCRPTALALLARAYLSVRNYRMAGLYADSALQIYHALNNYNKLDTNALVPNKKLNNPEVLYQASFISPGASSGYPSVLNGVNINTRVDTTLLASYNPNDLRKKIFYVLKPNDSSYFKGSYSGSIYPFGGFATDELFLIRAECFARAGQATAAMNDVDTLLSYRYRTGTFVPYTVASPKEALDSVLAERRRELVFRGLRWTDLRRLNKEGSNITLTRNVSTIPSDPMLYTLTPNSPNYVLPIPPDVLKLTGITNNQRQ